MFRSMFTRARVATLILPLVVLAGCATDDQTDTAAPEGDSTAAGTGASTSADAADETNADASAPANSDCAATDAELIDINSEPGEPTVQIPLLPGWERNTQMDSELVRIVLTNPDLVRDEFAPNIVVTAEPAPADHQEAFDLQLAGVGDMLGPEGPETEEGEVCGFPSMSFEQPVPPMEGAPDRQLAVQMIVVPHGSDAITYTMTAQATEPSDPAYGPALETMFSEIQISD